MDKVLKEYVMSDKALYRKMNDGTGASSTYHKKDGTNVRAKLKSELLSDVKQSKNRKVG